MKFTNTGRALLVTTTLRTLIIALAAIVAFASAQAQTRSGFFPYHQFTARMDAGFQQAEVTGDVTIILADIPKDEVIFEGHPRDIQTVKTSIKNGKLVLLAHATRTFEELRIYIPATSLNLLIVNGDANIMSAGKIKGPDLKILVNGTSLVAVDYEGLLNITPAEGYDLLDARGYKK